MDHPQTMAWPETPVVLAYKNWTGQNEVDKMDAPGVVEQRLT